jgi:tetratricopeptide (TPR) repeat protein
MACLLTGVARCPAGSSGGCEDTGPLHWCIALLRACATTAEAAQRDEEERLKAEAAQRRKDERLKAEAAQREKEQRRNQAALDRQLAEQLYQKLVRELSNGKIKTMVPGLRNIIKLNPEHAKAHRDMASQLQLVGEWDEALAEARLAMRLGPTDESALRLHGEIVAAIAKRNAVQEAPVSGKDAPKETSSRKREIVTKETELKEKAEAEQRYQVEATYLEGKACLDKHAWLKARRLLNRVSLMKPGHKDVEKLIASVEYRVILMLLGILGGIGAFSLIIYWLTYR